MRIMRSKAAVPTHASRRMDAPMRRLSAAPVAAKLHVARAETLNTSRGPVEALRVECSEPGAAWVVGIHGLPGSRLELDPLTEEIVSSNHHALMLSFPYHGLSGPATEGPRWKFDLVDDYARLGVEILRTQLGTAPGVHLLEHSCGGEIGRLMMGILAKEPEARDPKILSKIAIAPWAPTDYAAPLNQTSNGIVERMLGLPLLGRLGTMLGGRVAFGGMVSAMFHDPRGAALFPAYRQAQLDLFGGSAGLFKAAAAKMLERTSAVQIQVMDNAGAYSDAMLKALGPLPEKFPVLHIMGAEDRILPDTDRKPYQRGVHAAWTAQKVRFTEIGGETLVKISGCGHNAAVEKPDELAEAVVTHLESLQAGSGSGTYF